MERLTPPNSFTHSAADWNFNNDAWELSATHCVSPPYSLWGNGPPTTTVMCNLPDALNVRDGQFITYFYRYGPTVPLIVFRSQQNPLINNDDGYYRVHLRRLAPSSLEYISTAVSYEVGQWILDLPGETWHRVRITFWSGSNPQGGHALVCRLEKWVAGAWQSFGQVYDNADRHRDSSVNALGFWLYATVHYVDDTQIWRPA